MNFLFFLISLTACLLCIDTTSRLSLHCFTASLLTTSLICWTTVLFPRLWRRIVQFVIGEVFIFICVVDCYCQEVLATPITPQILSNVLLSDVRETHEFFSSFVGFHVISHWRITALLLLSIILPLILFFQPRFCEQYKWGYWTWGMALSVCVICEIPASYRFIQLFRHPHDPQYMEGLIFRHYHEEIPTPLHRFVFAWYSLGYSTHVLNDIKCSSFSAQVDSCSHLSPHIVLVIGESYNKHHSTLYAYPLPTTPLQQKRMDGEELFVFNDVVTPWNITSNVFLSIFSVWEYEMSDKVGKKPLFPILFRRAGYSVRFFSNQYLLRGFRKGATNQAGHFFLADTEVSDSLFDYRNRHSYKFDMGLVERIASFRRENEQMSYTLDIIHLVGQHFEYSQRYPKADATFNINDYKERKISNEAKQIVMHYDNATHYDDEVLNAILSVYEQEDAIVLFVADHGEEVYDGLPVHGRLFQQPNAEQAKSEFEVPMWIWCSESYRQNHPYIAECLKKSVKKPFMTDGIPQVLFSLAGISCQWNDESRNLLSPQYQKKRRIIGGNTDYDELVN